MTVRRVPAFAFTMIAIVGLGVQAEAKAPCQELVRLRNAASEAWKQAMSDPYPKPEALLDCVYSHARQHDER